MKGEYIEKNMLGKVAKSVVAIDFLSFIFPLEIGKMKERGFLYGLKLQCIILSDSSWS